MAGSPGRARETAAASSNGGGTGSRVPPRQGAATAGINGCAGGVAPVSNGRRQGDTRSGGGGWGPWLRAFLWHEEPERYSLHRKANLAALVGLVLLLTLFSVLAALDRRPVHPRRVPCRQPPSCPHASSAQTKGFKQYQGVWLPTSMPNGNAAEQGCVFLVSHRSCIICENWRILWQQARAMVCCAAGAVRVHAALVSVAAQLQAARALEVAAMRDAGGQHARVPGGLHNRGELRHAWLSCMQGKR